jgi:phosphoserine phosphatase
MTPASTGGSLEPHIAGPITYGEGKLIAIKEARPSALLLGAFGDSAWDAAMLRASRVPVAVRPGPSLIEVAASIPGLVTLEV